MNFIQRWAMGTLMRIADKTLKVDYKKIDKQALEDWGFRSFDDKGWRSYFAYEDLKLMKEMTYGKDRDQYMLLIGRRLQLLYLFDEMRKSVENKRSREEKKASEAKKAKE